MKHVLTPEVAAYLGGLPSGHLPRRSTPPSPAKAARFRLRRACAETWAELRAEAPVPLAVALLAAIGWFLGLVFC